MGVIIPITSDEVDGEEFTELSLLARSLKAVAAASASSMIMSKSGSHLH
jgi:hypothetical protein